METKLADAVVPGTRVDDVPDDLLELILLRLDSPIWIIRAASTCKRWRGIIADDGGAFLRRVRSLHPPTIAGHYHQREQHPTSINFVPTSPPVLPDTSRFSLDFLRPFGEGARWLVKDCHGGLVLLQRLWPCYLVVCDPLTRRYRKVNGTVEHLNGHFFLLDGEDGTISMSNFRVFHRSYGEARSGVFSTADGESGDVVDRWRAVPPASKDDAAAAYVEFAGRVDGSLYVGTVRGSVLALDNASLELNKVHLPSRLNTLGLRGPSMFCVVEHCAGRGESSNSPPAPRIVHVKCGELEVFRRVHGSDNEWVLEHSISRLREAFGRLAGHTKKYDRVCKVVVGGVGFVILLVYDSNKSRWPFSLCLDTMEVNVGPELSCYHGTTDASIYTLPWPPLMSACTG